MSERIVHVSCVRHTYPDRTTVHLCGLDFVVEKGQRVVILGPNGCGKSTLLYHLLGLLQSQEGEVRVFGVDPARQFSKIRERIGVLLQNADEQIIAPTVYDDVSFSPRNYGYTDHEVEEKVASALGRVGIEHLRHKVCHYLSGGEKRKVALAGALVLDPELLVLDEPFEGLDPSSRNEIVELLNRLNREHGVSLVVATHDVQLVAPLADKVYVLKAGGEIVAQGPPEQIFRDVDLLKASNIEPPVLAELFQRLEKQGITLGRPATADDAVRLLAEYLRNGAPAAPPMVLLPPVTPPARPRPEEIPPTAGAGDLFGTPPPAEEAPRP
jgi:cobalt/nickel transport system ATP-binding protein